MMFGFGDYDLSRLLACLGISRQVMPARSLTRTSVPGMDGCHVSEQGLSPLEIEVDVALWATDEADVADARRELASALSGGDKRLILPDEPHLAYLARFEGGGGLDRLFNSPSTTLTFLCADPIAYGSPRTATVATAATLVNAGGTYKARPVVACKPASGSSWTLTNVTTGDFVTVQAAFTGSQAVVLDMAKERCTIDGVDHAVTIASDFFALDGAQTLKTSSGTATLEWEERWL